eukprot:3382532-Amphidinium_carterae.1
MVCRIVELKVDNPEARDMEQSRAANEGGDGEESFLSSDQCATFIESKIAERFKVHPPLRNECNTVVPTYWQIKQPLQVVRFLFWEPPKPPKKHKIPTKR